MHRFIVLLIIYAAVAVVFTMIDVGWLALVAADIFKRQLGGILRDAPDLRVALAFYALYAAGLVVLAVWPALARRRPSDAVIKGGVLGFTAYATFDLTNLAIIKSWSAQLALVDMAWGTFASAIAAAAGYVSGAWLLARSAAGDVPRPK